MLIAPLLLASAICSPAGSHELVGRWESHVTSKGGIGSVMEYRQDGSFVEAAAILAGFRYEVRNDTVLIHEHGSAQRSSENPLHFHFEDGVFVQKEPDGSTIRRERVGKRDPKDPEIVGVWRYRHYTGGIAFERYTPDGDLLFRLPMTSSTGCYVPSMEKHEVLLAPLKGAARTVSLALSATQLRLKSPGKPDFVYDRSPWGNWYDIDRIDIILPRGSP